MPETGSDTADPDLLIDFKGVSLRRDGRVLVGPVDWAVELDERWVVIGPNGAGKTSLLNMISGFYKPDTGRIAYEGRDITRSRPHQVAAL
ncbi:MAG: ATP-binding cassette domain-containing protein, partial [Mycobacterium sp.]